MDNRKKSSPEPWDDHYYQTGSTQPPKSRAGLIALVLILGIALIGTLSALGILRIRVQLSADSNDAVNFTPFDPTVVSQGATDPSDSVTVPTGDVSVQIKPSPDSVLNIPQEGGLGLQEIYAKNIPSVVSISCALPGGSSSGTGVVLTADGYLVTNAHVIEDAVSISVLLTDGRTLSAQLVGMDTVSDLAVLYVNANDLTPAEFGDSSQLKVGDAVAAIGDPLGVELRGTMTDGIISAINRDMNLNGRTVTLIQTNAALNSGNSGGPLINCYGQVIGINTMKIGAFSDSAGVEGLGFAIPSVTVKEIVDQLIRQGYVSGRPALPLDGEWVSLFNQQFRRLPAGLYITQAPADSVISTRDILLQIDGVRVTSEDELNAALYQHQAGDTVTLTFYRSGSQYTTTITLTEAGK
ncbi:MAG: PDZ domain-containing protein [Ruminococcaceae bacterium]|nr:PDZ domain-containing protein [Oscillospiraceae bacterium]